MEKHPLFQRGQATHNAASSLESLGLLIHVLYRFVDHIPRQALAQQLGAKRASAAGPVGLTRLDPETGEILVVDQMGPLEPSYDLLALCSSSKPLPRR